MISNPKYGWCDFTLGNWFSLYSNILLWEEISMDANMKKLLSWLCVAAMVFAMVGPFFPLQIPQK